MVLEEFHMVGAAEKVLGNVIANFRPIARAG